MTTEATTIETPAPTEKNGWPVCGNCGLTAFSHHVTAKTDRYAKGGHKNYSTSCSYKDGALTSGQLFEAMLALTSFTSAPKGFKATKALGTRAVNETVLKAKRAKSKTIYLAAGRYFETIAEARQAGGVIHKATTSWTVAS